MFKVEVILCQVEEVKLGWIHIYNSIDLDRTWIKPEGQIPNSNWNTLIGGYGMPIINDIITN